MKVASMHGPSASVQERAVLAGTPEFFSLLVEYHLPDRQPFFQDNQWVFDGLTSLFPSLPPSLFDSLLPVFPYVEQGFSNSQCIEKFRVFSSVFEDLVQWAYAPPERISVDSLCEIFPEFASTLRMHESLLTPRFLPCSFLFLLCSRAFNEYVKNSWDLVVYRTLLTLVAWFFVPFFYTHGFLGNEVFLQSSPHRFLPFFGFTWVKYSEYSFLVPFFSVDAFQSVLFSQNLCADARIPLSSDFVALFLPFFHLSSSRLYFNFSELMEEAFFFYFFSLPSLDPKFSETVQFSKSGRQSTRLVSPSSGFYFLEPALCFSNESLCRTITALVNCKNELPARFAEDNFRLKSVPMFSFTNLFVTNLEKCPMEEDMRTVYTQLVTDLFATPSSMEFAYPYVMSSSIGFK